MKKPSISFFCPAYYDEKNIPILIPKIINVLQETTSGFEVLIVDDGSPDKTGEVADSLANKYSHLVKVIHHKKNLGYGAALRTGFLSADKFDFVFYTDGDIQYDVDEIKKMLPYLNKYEVVIGFRSKRALTTSRQLQTAVYNFIVRILFGLQIKDINCSMKIISRKALSKINLESNGAFIDAELLIKLKKNNYKIKEVEVTHFPRKFGKASGGSIKVIYKTLSDLVRFYFKNS